MEDGSIQEKGNMSRKYFGTDGVRGIANRAPMSPDMVMKVGLAAGSLRGRCRLALEANIQRADSFIVSAADTAKTIPTRELFAEIYPSVPLARALGEFETPFDHGKARRVLGYEPKHSWRDYL